MMNAVIYAHYSSDNQREESIEGQIRECTRYAELHNMHIVGKYIDRALSGKTDKRADFQRMIKDSEKGRFDTVILYTLDRFARNRYDNVRYKAQLKKNGVKVLSATESISDGAECILLEAMLEGMVEYYSADLAENVVRSMTENALKCKYNDGTLPMGYTVDSEQYFQINSLTAPLILEAFKKYSERATITDIRDCFNNQGMKNTRGQPLTYNSVKKSWKPASPARNWQSPRSAPSS